MRPTGSQSHALLEGCQLTERGPRDGDHGHVALVQVRNDAVEIVSSQRAMRASHVVTRMKHEVIDNELAASVKELSQTLTPVRSIKNIVFADVLPRKLTTLLVKLVAKASEFFSLARNAVRAESQSSCDTTGWFFTVMGLALL